MFNGRLLGLKVTYKLLCKCTRLLFAEEPIRAQFASQEGDFAVRADNPRGAKAFDLLDIYRIAVGGDKCGAHGLKVVSFMDYHYNKIL